MNSRHNCRLISYASLEVNLESRLFVWGEAQGILDGAALISWTVALHLRQCYSPLVLPQLSPSLALIW